MSFPCDLFDDLLATDGGGEPFFPALSAMQPAGVPLLGSDPEPPAVPDWLCGGPVGQVPLAQMPVAPPAPAREDELNKRRQEAALERVNADRKRRKLDLILPDGSLQWSATDQGAAAATNAPTDVDQDLDSKILRLPAPEEFMPTDLLPHRRVVPEAVPTHATESGSMTRVSSTNSLATMDSGRPTVEALAIEYAKAAASAVFASAMSQPMAEPAAQGAATMTPVPLPTAAPKPKAAEPVPLPTAAVNAAKRAPRAKTGRRSGRRSGKSSHIQFRATRHCAGCLREKKRVYKYVGATAPFCNACNQHWRRHSHSCEICDRLADLGACQDLRGADVCEQELTPAEKMAILKRSRAARA